MPNERRFREIEIKLRVSDPRATRDVLSRLRARKIMPRTHELNTLYDTPDQGLRRRGELIRTRTEEAHRNSRKKQASEAGRVILTYKAPARSRGARTERGRDTSSRRRFKIREEAEVFVVGQANLDRILRGLGLRPQFRYEKYRTTYLLQGIDDVKVELDETPVGDYLELEGSPSGIDRAATLLGYSRSDYIVATYGGLYLADCRRRGRKPGDMLFPNAKKSR